MPFDLPLADTALDLSRWQFALTTIYHFLFVPLTIGLAYTLAVMQTLWWRTADEQWLRLTRFFGKLFLINFAIGVATGLVQEFQFGMNWSEYSRFVGDVFGAPLAMEGLLAFFLESTFIGLWVFGWNRLKPGVHLATIWLVAIGTTLSAYFILAANAWMQDPVGFKIVAGKPEMTSIFAVLFNETAVLAFFHTMAAAAVTGSFFVLGVAAFHLRRGQDVQAFNKAARLAAAIAVPAAIMAFVIGDDFMRNMVERQPMKVAAAEALYDTESKVGLSVFAVAPLEANPGETTINLQVPYLLSVLATNSFDGEVQGINQLQAQYEKKYGPGDYVPPVGVVYWGFRGMVYIGGALIAIALWAGWLAWKDRLRSSSLFLKVAVWSLPLPFLANTAGWIYTEVGRQPWVVQGLQKTSNGVSVAVPTWQIVAGLVTFLVIYAILIVVEFFLLKKYAQRLPDPARDESERTAPVPAMSY
ncbi:MAG: cytochrome ubiquinol oxidase subunit I [Solirubrobacteraceae bacterium]|nr:cytochrome ubiquinol oxidase subunit I [Solirubrobacteraceae bacterium]